jgi:hypothetical protein
MPCCLLCTLRISPLTYEFEHMHESQAMATESRTPMMEGAIGKEGARHDVLPLLHLHRVTISSLSHTSRSGGERKRWGGGSDGGRGARSHLPWHTGKLMDGMNRTGATSTTATPTRTATNRSLHQAQLQRLVQAAQSAEEGASVAPGRGRPRHRS